MKAALVIASLVASRSNLSPVVPFYALDLIRKILPLLEMLDIIMGIKMGLQIDYFHGISFRSVVCPSIIS
jgi:hypothetical protein